MKMMLKKLLVLLLCSVSLAAAQMELTRSRREQPPAIAAVRIYQSDACAICLAEYTVAEPAVLFHSALGTTCGHQFHSACLAQVLQYSCVCPICRFSAGALFSIDELISALSLHKSWCRKLLF